MQLKQKRICCTDIWKTDNNETEALKQTIFFRTKNEWMFWAEMLKVNRQLQWKRTFCLNGAIGIPIKNVYNLKTYVNLFLVCCITKMINKTFGIIIFRLFYCCSQGSNWVQVFCDAGLWTFYHNFNPLWVQLTAILLVHWEMEGWLHVPTVFKQGNEVPICFMSWSAKMIFIKLTWIIQYTNALFTKK